MSLINQMLRDLQQRQNGGSTTPAPRPSRRQFSPESRRRTIPAMVWVSFGGMAGVVLLIGLAGGLSGLVGPDALPVPSPPKEMPAVANAPSPAVSTAPPTTQAGTVPGPLEVPSQASQLIREPTNPARVVPATTAKRIPDAALAAGKALPAESLLARPPSSVQPLAVVAGRRSTEGAKTVAREAVIVQGFAERSPGRLHPDLLPGAVNTTNLALQEASRQIAAVPPPVRTPYGQAEDAYRQGLLAYSANHTETSLQALRRALELYPGHLPARELLADQYEMAGRTEEALTLLQKGLTIAPDYTPLRKRMARLLLDHGDAVGATKALIGSGLPKVEDDPELHQILAGIYRQLGENFLAAQTYRNLLSHDPGNGSFWAGLGDVLTADGQPGEAHKAYRRALMVGGLSRESMALVQQKLDNR